MTTQSLDALIAELAAFLSPIGRALRSENGVNRLLAELGVVSTADDPLGATLDDPIPAAGDPALVAALNQVATIETQVRALIAQPDASFDTLAQGLDLARSAVTALSNLSNVSAAAPGGLTGTSRDVLDLLLTGWLTERHPLFRSVAILLTLIQPVEEQPEGAAVVVNGAVTRLPFYADRFQFSKLADVVRDPLGVLRAEYGNALATEADATAVAQKLWPRLDAVLSALGIHSTFGISPLNAPDLGDAAPIMDRTLIVYADNQLAGAPNESGIVVSLSPATQGDLGVVLTPFGTLTFTRAVGDWQMAASVTAGVDAVAWGRNGITLVAGASTTEFTAGFSATLPKPDSGPAFVIGQSTGTRLEIGSMRFAVDTHLSDSSRSVGVSADFKDLQIIVGSSDSDGFLGSILPAGGLRVKADLGLGWSSASGLSLRGSASLDATLPIGLSIGGIAVPSLHVSLSPANGAVRAEVTASISASIGPVKALVDGVGVSGTLSFPNTGGALGFADVALGLRGPTGLALSVDAAGVVSGSGFLFHDAAHSTYVGALQVTLHDTLTLTALGLIATTLPDGSRGYSLLVFITAQDFKPIPLGLGFTLQGIGGLVAINRTFDEQVIRAGLQNDTLKTLLFPQDPVTNAVAIVRTLETAFPARRGSYLLGLLARIGWGTPTLLQFDLALILELGARERLIALGRVTATLPTPSNALLHLTLDALGVLDFDAGTIALDAQLVDSRLAGVFAITGAGALRAGWGGSGPGKAFLLSVGGFNPRFVPPAGVPALPRVAIALSSGNNPRLTCEAYFALTANTVQFGARAQLVASAGGFSLVGVIGFDVLFDSPVHFLADFQASVQLKAGSTNLFTVAVSGTLEGLLPLRFSGKARFEILWCHITVRVRATLRDGVAPTVAAVDAVPLLVAALTNVGNWSTQRAAGATQGVALRSVASNGTSVANTPTAPASSGSSAVLVLDPLGTLAVTQNVVPLGTGRDVDRVQGAPVSGAKRFTLTGTLGGSVTPTPTAPTQVTPLTGDFAPGQYFALTEDEQLASPSFERWQAGLTLGSEAATVADSQVVSAPLTYDAYVIDTPGAVLPAPTSYVLPAGQVAAHAATGAAARAPARRVGRARFRVAGPPQVALASPAYAVVSATTGAPVATAPEVQTWSEHQAVVDTLNRTGQSYAVVAAA